MPCCMRSKSRVVLDVNRDKHSRKEERLIEEGGNSEGSIEKGGKDY